MEPEKRETEIRTLLFEIFFFFFSKVVSVSGSGPVYYFALLRKKNQRGNFGTPKNFIAIVFGPYIVFSHVHFSGENEIERGSSSYVRHLIFRSFPLFCLPCGGGEKKRECLHSGAKQMPPRRIFGAFSLGK